MLGKLALQRTNWAALAVLAALVGALFVALQPASAAGCALNPGLTLGFNQSCEIDVAKINKEATGLVVADSSSDVVAVAAIATTTENETDFTITGQATTGERRLNLTKPAPTDDDASAVAVVASFDVTVAGFGIAKVDVVGDSDNVVSAGAPVMVSATVRSPDSENADIRLTVPTTGLSIQATNADGTTPTGATTQQQTRDVPASTAEAPLPTVIFTVNTAGAPVGEYDLTFTADNNGTFTDTASTAAEATKRDTATLTLTIGEPGTGLSSATLTLGNSAEDLPYTDTNEARAETGTASASGDGIKLVIEAFDSNGGKANSSAINQIIVIAPGGSITSDHDTGAVDNSVVVNAGGSSSATLNEVDADAGSGGDADDVGQRTQITVSKADMKPGSVTVYAIVSGPGGAARTEDITLTFSGAATSMSIADATETLLAGDTDSIKLVVTAEDSGGNSAAPPTGGVNIVITDPDGKRQGGTVIGRDQPVKEGSKYVIKLTGMGTKDAPLTAGNWTVKATSGKLEATAMFAVAGAPADVEVSASAMSSDTIGDVITVTASVTDKDGNTVSDGTPVSFATSPNTGLAAIGTGHTGQGTKDGQASAKFAVVGAGHSVVSVIAGDATGVIVIDSTAGVPEPEAMPEEEASVSCLSNLSGFSTWSCGVESSAAEIFGLVSGRGASAVHLWNGSEWVRYSVVEGNAVPGSSDFMVTEDDILYISN